ncbi:pyruvate carboxylase subunit B [Propylenella binzhouense]|uniref:Pyruvate carboxylase subunit B n=1 Tax=Propylenella binzhouense TaxID=2555902 RepID=A0A964WVR4_9HYPH|nr:pyruvate carboxylase subunit B [Propylenella binzhouense]MYZ50512.1 pyruvate carboxylase subunit B [Propylenella binzhouense]
MKKKINVIETTLRDGQQSLWATRMTTPMLYPVLPVLDRAGFDAIECMGTAVMDSCVRYLREDPWERLRLLGREITRTPLQMIGICIGFSVGKALLADDILELFFRRCAQNGIDRFFLMDGLNDIRNFEVPIRAAHKEGAKVLGAVVYSISPVHSDEHFVEKTRELADLGADTLVLKDPNGILTPERARILVPKMRAVAPERPFYVHSHCVTGLGPAANLEAVRHGAEGLWTATRTLANGFSLPATDSMVRNLVRDGYAVDVDLDAVEEIERHFARVAARHKKPVGTPAEFDPAFYQHQMPGGMLSNFHAQMTQLGLAHRIDEVFDEIPAVREDLGWALMVTPFSQLIGTQAALNVLYGRYAVTLDEVDRLVLGYYGKTPGAVSGELLDSVTRRTGKTPIAERPGLTVEPVIERFRRENGPFASDEEMLLGYLFMPEYIAGLKSAGPLPLDERSRAGSVVDLVREVARRKDIKQFHLSMS